MALTAKQEAWALLVGSGYTYSKAYREVYEASGMAQKTGWEEASRVACVPQVSARVIELQEAAAERTLVTVESITTELNENRLAAQVLQQPAAMNAATMGKAKLHGLLVDKTLHGGDPDNPLPTAPVAIYQLPDNGRDGSA